MIDWQEYKRLKNNWIAEHPDATSGAYELAIKAIMMRLEDRRIRGHRGGVGQGLKKLRKRSRLNA